MLVVWVPWKAFGKSFANQQGLLIVSFGIGQIVAACVGRPLGGGGHGVLGGVAGPPRDCAGQWVLGDGGVRGPLWGLLPLPEHLIGVSPGFVSAASLPPHRRVVALLEKPSV